MGIKVLKFGGSSVADAIQFRKIKNIVEADDDRRYIVVSAPGKRYKQDNKITDLLYLCKTHIEHNLPYEQVFQVICDRYTIMQMNLGIDAKLELEFQKIRDELVKGASDEYMASRGEYLNAIVTAELLGYKFIDSAEVISFDADGKLLEKETNEKLKAVLSEYERAVLPGFYGSDVDGNIRTFSRGGSDITGSLVAKAVDAEIYENWTDVSGFLMADPRIVENPKQIENISYSELRELAYMGASVLHEDAIYPVKEAGIPINIRNTNEPENNGTIIKSNAHIGDDRTITGIAGSKDFSVIAIFKNGMSKEIGFFRRLFSIMEDRRIPIEHMPSSIDTASIIVATKYLAGKEDEVVDEIKRILQPDTVEVFNDMSLIATVGSGMSKRLGVSAQLFKALADSKVNVRMIDQGSSEMNIIVGVENKDFEKAIRSIYSTFEK